MASDYTNYVAHVEGNPRRHLWRNLCNQRVLIIDFSKSGIANVPEMLPFLTQF
jgi:hypothetical protein